MSDDQKRFEELWNDYLEGELDESGMQELQTLLEQNAEFVKEATDTYQLHRLLGVLANEGTGDAFVRETMERLPSAKTQFVSSVMRQVSPARRTIESGHWKLLALSTVAAGLAVLATGLWFMRSEPMPNIVRVSAMGGSFLWTGDGGQVVNSIVSGSELGGGTLEGLAPDSWAQLQFLNDGTTVTLSGKSLLTFSEYSQKELHLREGNISADVAKQPTGRPMLIHTRSATLEVLGTKFDVQAQLTSTKLNVSQGKVRLKRLHDGSSLDVPAKHRAVAAADLALNLEQVPESVSHWQSNIPAGPENLLGKWLPATEASPARLRNVPLVVEIPNKDPLTIYIAALPISNGAGGPVRLESNADFQVSGELNGESDVFLGIHVVDDDGNFAGKFLAYTKVTPNSEGQFAVTLPASQFALDVTLREYKDQLPDSPVNFIVKDCWCFTLAQSGLALEEVELKPTQ